MASFSVEKKNKYETKSFQDVKNSYDWLTVSLSQLNLHEESFSSKFSFKTGEIRCQTEGIDEFVENAYLSTDFSLIDFSIYTTFDNSIWIHIIVDNFGVIRISSEDKKVLQSFTEIMDRTEIKERKASPVNHITINGGNNAIANDFGSATVVENSKRASVDNSRTSSIDKKKKSKFSEFFSTVFANIVSNALWYILSFLIGALLSYLIAKNIS